MSYNVSSTWPNRREAADRLLINERTLRRWETKGILQAHVDEHGVHRFDPIDLDRHRPASACTSDDSHDPGAVAAKVFALLNAGRDPREVVVELRIEPKRVQALYAEWLVMGRLLPLNHDDRVRLARLVGGFTSGVELVVAVEKFRDAAELARKFVFPCATCEQPIQATPAHWRAIVDAGVLRNWSHAACSQPE